MLSDADMSFINNSLRKIVFFKAQYCLVRNPPNYENEGVVGLWTEQVVSPADRLEMRGRMEKQREVVKNGIKGDIMRKKGFTLIELLVVIAIIALLLAILIPGLKMAKDISRRVICASRLRQVGVAMRSYSQTYEYLPDSKDRNLKPEGGHTYVVYRGDGTQWFRDGKPIPLRWAKLYAGDFMDEPEIFYCPGNRLDTYKYESYIKPTEWGTVPQDYNVNTANEWVRIGYTYYPIARNPVLTAGTWIAYAPPAEDLKFNNLSTSLPYATDLLWGRPNIAHQRMQSSDPAYKESNNYTLNALYADAHVGSSKDPEVFKPEIWTRFGGSTPEIYAEGCFTIFKLIGNR